MQAVTPSFDPIGGPCDLLSIPDLFLGRGLGGRAASGLDMLEHDLRFEKQGLVKGWLELQFRFG